MNQEPGVIVGNALHEALQQLMRDHSADPSIYRAVPLALAGMAGSHLGTMQRGGLFADGEADKAFLDMVKSMGACWNHARQIDDDVTGALRDMRERLK